MQEIHYKNVLSALYDLQITNQITQQQKKFIKIMMAKEDQNFINLAIKTLKNPDLRKNLMNYLKQQSLEVRRYANINTQQRKNNVTPLQLTTNLPRYDLKKDQNDSINRADKLCSDLVQKSKDLQQLSPTTVKTIKRIKQSMGDIIIQHSSATSSPLKSPTREQGYDHKIQMQALTHINLLYKKQVKNNFEILFKQLMKLNKSDISEEKLMEIMKNLLNLAFGYSDFSFLIEEGDSIQFFESFNGTQTVIKQQTQPEEFTRIQQQIENIPLKTLQNLDQDKNLFDSFSQYKNCQYIKYRTEPKLRTIVLYIHNQTEYYPFIQIQESGIKDQQVVCQQLIDLCSVFIDCLRNYQNKFYIPGLYIGMYLDLFREIIVESQIYFFLKIKQIVEYNSDEVLEINKELKKNQTENLMIQCKQENYYYSLYPKDRSNKLNKIYSNKLQEIFNKYQKKVTKYTNKIFDYKLSRKQTFNKTFFDFNESGELIFVNCPISNEKIQKFYLSPSINEYSDLTIEELFVNNKKFLDDFNELRQKNGQKYKNNYVQITNIPEIEIYFEYTHKIKGFSVTITEELEKCKSIERINNSQTLNRSLSNSSWGVSQRSNKWQESLDQLKINSSNKNNEHLSDKQKQVLKRKIQKVVNCSQTALFLSKLANDKKLINETQLSLFLPEELVYQGANLQPNQKRLRKIIKPKELKVKTFQISKFGVDIFTKIDDNFISLDWNVLQYNNIKDLHRVAYTMLETGGWLEKYQIENTVLIEFLQEMEKKYNKKKNPFHNYQHGIQVMQGCFALSKGTSASKYLNDFEIFVLTFSGLCHDINHTGRTNIFEINSQSKLALRYNDNSVLEQHHLSTTFKVLRQDKMNVFRQLPQNQFLEIRKIMVSNILYTDIKRHFSLQKDFENIIKDRKESRDMDYVLENIDEVQEEPAFGSTPEEIRLLAGMVIHAADFTGGIKKFDISRQWSERVNLEFASQYEEEGRLKIQQTPFMKDLHKPHVMAKGEIGFFQFIVKPHYTQLNTFLGGDLQEYVDNMADSIAQWTIIMEKYKKLEEEENQKLLEQSQIDQV